MSQESGDEPHWKDQVGSERIPHFREMATLFLAEGDNGTEPRICLVVHASCYKDRRGRKGLDSLLLVV